LQSKQETIAAYNQWFLRNHSSIVYPGYRG